MNDEINTNAAAPEEIPVEGNPEQGLAPDAPQGQGDKTEEVSNLAMQYIYGDAKAFASMIEMLKSNKSDPAKGIGEAAVMIVEKIEQDTGEMQQAELATAGMTVVISLLDLANKAGIIPEVTKDIGAKAWGAAIQIYMKKYPGKIDPASLQKIAQESGMMPEQGAQQMPAEQMPAEQETGLLGA